MVVTSRVANMDNSAPAKEETQNYCHFLWKSSVPLQLTGCTEKADCVRRKIQTDFCRQAPPENSPSRHRRQLAQSLWITEKSHMGIPEPCGTEESEKQHWGTSTCLFLYLLLQNFSWGSTCSVLEHRPLISLSGLACNCQPCNLLVLGQLAGFTLSWDELFQYSWC